jgi:hypothetical protein
MLQIDLLPAKISNRLAATFVVLLFILGCTKCPGAGASCNVDRKDLPKLLQSIKPSIEKGFGDSEIQVLQRLADSTPVKEYATKDFSITHRGKDSILHVELKVDDGDEVDIWFVTEPELVAEIQKKMQER